jgi:predicted DNA binding CopG/RHH family protein
MQMAQFLESLEGDLDRIAAVGDDAVAQAADRLTQAIRGSAGMRLLEALGEAAVEVSAQLPAGHVEVRMTGQDPTLVYVEEEQQAPAAAPADDEASARITLRLPESLKAQIEIAASGEGLSVNAWVIRALARGLDQKTIRPGRRLTGYAES